MRSQILSPKSIARIRQRFEQQIRGDYREMFDEEDGSGYRDALEGILLFVLSRDYPRPALAAALYVLFTWIHPITEEKLLKILCDIVRDISSNRDEQGKPEQTVAFVNGVEFICQTKKPVVDVDSLYVVLPSN